MYPSQIANIILNITFIATFIGLFFFTYGKNVEEYVVKSQSEFIAETISKDIAPFLSKDTALKLTQNITVPNMSEEDKHVEQQNNTLQAYAFKILSVLFISGLLITWLISKSYNLNFLTIIKNNLIILFFVGLTEYLFLTYIGQNILSADPNFVRYKILSILKNKLVTSETPNVPLMFQNESQKYLQPIDKITVQNYLQKNNITLSP
jgi:hypothetical protein